jgi:hypothetical protein
LFLFVFFRAFRGQNRFFEFKLALMGSSPV